MPNHVTNVVKMKNIVNANIFKEDEPECIDFNKLVMMPYNIENTAETSDIPIMIQAYVLYLYKKAFPDEVDVRASFTERYNLYNTLAAIPKTTICDYRNTVDEYINKRFGGEITNEMDLRMKLYDLAEQGRWYIENLFLNGALTWYGWSIKNWGTKWNAYNGAVIDEDNIQFCTAWDPPIPVMVELSRKYPMNEINLAYMSEDVGYAGEMVFHDGEIIQDDQYGYMTYESIELGKRLFDGYCYATGMYPEDTNRAFGIISEEDMKN